MRRLALAVLLLGSTFFAVSSGYGGEKAAPINIEYHGQSFFIVTSSKGTRLAFDPHTIPAYFDGRPQLPSVDVVCISHNHPDHIRVEVFKDPEKGKEKPKVLRGLKSASTKADWATVNETVKDFKIRNVGVFHDDSEGLQRGKNSVFIVEVDGWKIAHLGDLGHLLTPAQLKRIGPVDVIMIPVGGIYTLNGAEAKKVVAQLKPKEYVFPMHFGTKIFEDILSPDEFFEDQPARNVVRLSDSENDPAKRDNTITLNRDPNRPRPLIVQLHYFPKEAPEPKKKEEKDKK
ncbi:MAG TPA: MBL fold metallo-hydrolase [Gemmataceae bacterium]|nr:MBL fold metallo-hydrolase [Gemmataceae bacterium]